MQNSPVYIRTKNFLCSAFHFCFAPAAEGARELYLPLPAFDAQCCEQNTREGAPRATVQSRELSTRALWVVSSHGPSAREPFGAGTLDVGESRATPRPGHACLGHVGARINKGGWQWKKFGFAGSRSRDQCHCQWDAKAAPGRLRRRCPAGEGRLVACEAGTWVVRERVPGAGVLASLELHGRRPGNPGPSSGLRRLAALAPRAQPERSGGGRRFDP